MRWRHYSRCETGCCSGFETTPHHRVLCRGKALVFLQGNFCSPGNLILRPKYRLATLFLAPTRLSCRFRSGFLPFLEIWDWFATSFLASSFVTARSSFRFRSSLAFSPFGRSLRARFFVCEAISSSFTLWGYEVLHCACNGKVTSPDYPGNFVLSRSPASCKAPAVARETASAIFPSNRTFPQGG